MNQSNIRQSHLFRDPDVGFLFLAHYTGFVTALRGTEDTFLRHNVESSDVQHSKSNT